MKSVFQKSDYLQIVYQLDFLLDMLLTKAESSVIIQVVDRHTHLEETY